MKSKFTYRQLTALLFLAVFLIQTFNKTFVIADYNTNTGKYAANCENKAKPQMHCNGKCQMMKKIKAEEKKDQENPERKSENKNEVLLSSKSFFATIIFPIIELNSATKISHHSNGKCIDRSFDIFHPPQFSLSRSSDI